MNRDEPGFGFKLILANIPSQKIIEMLFYLPITCSIFIIVKDSIEANRISK